MGIQGPRVTFSWHFRAGFLPPIRGITTGYSTLPGNSLVDLVISGVRVVQQQW